jgi:hypothetical protein
MRNWGVRDIKVELSAKDPWPTAHCSEEAFSSFLPYLRGSCGFIQKVLLEEFGWNARLAQ